MVGWSVGKCELVWKTYMFSLCVYSCIWLLRSVVRLIEKKEKEEERWFYILLDDHIVVKSSAP